MWFGDGRYLLFSDIPNNRMLCWSEVTGAVTVFRDPSNNANGNTRDLHGRLVTCEHLTRRVTRTEYDGSITRPDGQLRGQAVERPERRDRALRRLGVVHRPRVGHRGELRGDKAVKQIPRYVFRVDADTGEGAPSSPTWTDRTGSASHPTSPCCTSSMSTSSGSTTWTVRAPVNGRVFVATSGFDGIRTDRDGNVWAAAGWGGAGFDGVHCYSPAGELLGQIHLPESCSNFCFGGAKRNRLFITASRSLYTVYVEAQGAQRP